MLRIPHRAVRWAVGAAVLAAGTSSIGCSPSTGDIRIGTDLDVSDLLDADLPRACREPRDCAGGETCREGVCRAVCAATADCAGTPATPYCDTRAAVCVGCRDDLDCREGERCLAALRVCAAAADPDTGDDPAEPDAGDESIDISDTPDCRLTPCSAGFSCDVSTGVCVPDATDLPDTGDTGDDDTIDTIDRIDDPVDADNLDTGFDCRIEGCPGGETCDPSTRQCVPVAADDDPDPLDADDRIDGTDPLDADDRPDADNGDTGPCSPADCDPARNVCWQGACVALNQDCAGRPQVCLPCQTCSVLSLLCSGTPCIDPEPEPEPEREADADETDTVEIDADACTRACDILSACDWLFAGSPYGDNEPSCDASCAASGSPSAGVLACLIEESALCLSVDQCFGGWSQIVTVEVERDTEADIEPEIEREPEPDIDWGETAEGGGCFFFLQCLPDFECTGGVCERITRPLGGAPIELRIVLSWSVATIDFDLHLVRNDPAGFRRSSGSADDCNYTNCNIKDGTTPASHTIDWGVRGEPADDPYMLRDFISGNVVVPEEIIFRRPQPGFYFLIVERFSGSGSDAPQLSLLRNGTAAYSAVGPAAMAQQTHWIAARVEVRADGTVNVTAIDQVLSSAP